MSKNNGQWIASNKRACRHDANARSQIPKRQTSARSESMNPRHDQSESGNGDRRGEARNIDRKLGKSQAPTQP